MLSIQLIRQQTDFVKKGLEKKYFKSIHFIDDLLAIDEQRRKILTQQEECAASMNQYAKQIGALMATKETEKADTLKTKVSHLKTQVTQLTQTLQELEQQQSDILLQLPNLPTALVPEGKTPTENVLVKQGGEQFLPSTKGLPHWDLCKQYQLVDFELGNKVTGAGFPFYTHQGAKLQRALIQYFLDFNTKAGYAEYAAPILVNEESAFGTGQLPDKEGQMYVAQTDGLYLIPTAEVPLTNVFRNDIIEAKKLPLRLTGYTPCFRREAGSYGKDVRGLNRLHQFDKVEIVQLVEPHLSYATLDTMVSHVEQLLISLQLPYRILRLCAGDMSFASALTYDFEVFSAAQEKWLEVSSVSNFESFQTNRMKIRTKDENGKTQLLHSLNGSSLALPRIMAALLENHQTDNAIALPPCLHGYFGGTKIIR